MHLRVETTNSPFTSAAHKGQILRMPIAHGEGCYFADERTLDELEAEDRVAFRYLDNPNGSLRDIAGILNESRNVMGMMPHPERACRSADGLHRRPGHFRIHGLARRCPHDARRHHARARSRSTSSPPAEYQKIVAHPRPRAQLHRARHLQRDVERALLLQELAPASEEAAHARQAAWCRAPARTPASSTSAAATSIAFKIESHNHPSFIEPFQGAATGVGGILRDIFTMGARPIAVLDSLRFGRLDDPATGARNRRILEGVVAGIAHYGNCFGVPTVGGECIFEPCYNGNPLVNVFALGVCQERRNLLRARPPASAIP